MIAGSERDVSLLMVVRNGAPFIEAAIDSIEAQTCESWELLIVDDGSTDASRAIIRSRTNKRVRLIATLNVNTGYRGIGFVRNLALAASSGRYIGVMDADDLRYRDSLRSQLGCLRANRAAVGVSGPHDEIDSDGRLAVIERDVTQWRRSLVHAAAAEIQILAGRGEGGRRCPFAPSLTLLRAELVIGVGGYDESLRYHVDSDLYRRLATVGAFKFGVESLDAIRMHPGQLSVKKRADDWRPPSVTRELPPFDRRRYDAFL